MLQNIFNNIAYIATPPPPTGQKFQNINQWSSVLFCLQSLLILGINFHELKKSVISLIKMAMKLIIVAVFELNCADVDAFQTFRSRSKIYYCLWLIFRLHNIFYRDLSFILGKYEVPSCYWQIMDSWLPCHDIMIEYNTIPVYQIKIFTMITSQLGHVKENLGNTKLNTSCFLLLYNILPIYIIIYLNIRRVVFIFSNLLLN